MSANNDSQQYINEYLKREDEDMSADEDSDNRQTHSGYMLREQDRFLPICNIIKIMKIPVPENGKIAKDARECIQECVSEFISFITSEAIEHSMSENRKTVNGDDLLYAFANLGFDNYMEPLSVYLHKFREATKCDRNLLSESSTLQDDSSSDIRYSASNINPITSTTTNNTTNNPPNIINENATNICKEFEFQLKDSQKPPLRTYFNKNNINSLNSTNLMNVPSSILPLEAVSGVIATSSAMSSTSSCSPPSSSPIDQHESLRNFRKTSQSSCSSMGLSLDSQQQILNSVVTTQANDLSAGLLNPDHMIIFNTEELMQQVSQQQQQLQQHHQQQQLQQQQQQSQNSNHQQQQQQQTTHIFNNSQWPQQIKEENDFCNNFVF